jgi:hypothetical protein
MTNTQNRIRGQISSAILDKVNRLFRNDDAGVWVELLQNARRGGASVVAVDITECDKQCQIVVTDNGCGIQDFQNLLTLGGSDWSPAVVKLEDPAGMGFFALCHSEVEIHSGRKRTTLMPEVFLGRTEAEVVETEEAIAGTQIRFTRACSKAHLVTALKSVAEFGPIEVRIDGEIVSRRDFLEEAEHREWIDGVEIGIGAAFRWNWSHSDDNWNFYGARLRRPFHCPDGWLTCDQRGRWSTTPLYVRFDVRDTSALKLQLPDRRAIVEDEFFRSFERKVLTAVYRFLQTENRHALPFLNWKEAQDLGVVLPEAVPLLTTWHAAPQDEFFEPIFDSPETVFLDDIAGVLLVDEGIPNPHTLEAALATGTSLGLVIYKEHRAFQGYRWYDGIPRLTNTVVRLDGAVHDEWVRAGQTRPGRIEIEANIHDPESGDRSVVVPALVHVDSESPNEPVFAVVSNSPWDDSDRPQPFSAVDFLMWATFSASDDFGECDSWETQREEYQADIERMVSEYFGGARAALFAVLQGSIPWEAHTYLDQLDVDEIRFRRGVGHRIWNVEVIDRAGSGRTSVFDLQSVADINTAYLQESDCPLLEQPDCPTRFAITDDQAGTFHWVTSDPKLFAEEMVDAERFGLSVKFRYIMTRLHQAKVPYVRFDGEGGEIGDIDRNEQ